MPVTLLYPHRRHLPRRVRVFMDWLAGLFTEEAAATCSPTRL
jgi:DNA-binding transcriptional LysR family regulator